MGEKQNTDQIADVTAEGGENIKPDVPGFPMGDCRGGNRNMNYGELTPVGDCLDYLIYRAYYSKGKTFVSVSIMIIPTIIMMSGVYFIYKDEKYLLMSIWILIILMLYYLFIDSLSMDSISFYNDKIIKRSMVFGSVVVKYKDAIIVGPPTGLSWLTSGYQIKHKNSSILDGMPVYFIMYFFDNNTKYSVLKILDYLAGNNNGNPRLIEKDIINLEEFKNA